MIFKFISFYLNCFFFEKIIVAAKGAGIENYSSDEESNFTSQSQNNQVVGSVNLNPVVPIIKLEIGRPEDCNFEVSDFLIFRLDFAQDWPLLWRIDQKFFLQKFEPFNQNGKIFYRSTVTVSFFF